METFDSFDGIPRNYYFGFQESAKYISGSSSLVLDNERGELVKAMAKPGQKAANAEKALIALRNHSEAERRRRERINGHLATLRTLIPGADKMDKATLLGEVINQVKLLRQGVAEATNGTLAPTDIDEVKVEEEEDPNDDEPNCTTIRASLCSEFKHELLSDLREALEALPWRTTRAEMATFESRMVSIFVISGGGEEGKVVGNSVRQALRSVLDKFYASAEFTSSNASSKRRRVSFFGDQIIS